MICSRSTPRRALVTYFIATAAALTAWAATSAQAVPQSLDTRQAQARALEAEVGGLEERYDGLQEKVRGVRIELDGLQADAATARIQLERARARRAVAQRRLRDRALAMYRDGSASMLVEFAAGESFSDVFERLDAAQRISQNDAEMLRSISDLNERVEAREAKLKTALGKKQRLARKLARDDKKMRAVLDLRREALNSANADVRALMQQQRVAEAARSETASKARATAIAQGETVDPLPDADGSSSNTAGGTAAESSPSDASVAIPLPPGSGVAAAAANIAIGRVGSPYVWAAAGPDTFDCSGLVVWAFAQAGRPGLPHSTYSLIGMGIEVPLSQAQPGDLIFTNNTGHMGIYVGGGSMVHSPRTGRTVSVEPLTYYTVESVRRI